MKLLHRTGPGTVGLNYMWLPTWVGMNAALIKEIEEHIAPLLMGQALTDETFDKAGEAVIEFLVYKFPHINGIHDYLDGLKYVETADAQAQEEKVQAQEDGSAAPSGD